MQDAIQGLYADWIMENYPDEFMGKDSFIELCESYKYYEEFLDALRAEF